MPDETSHGGEANNRLGWARTRGAEQGGHPMSEPNEQLSIDLLIPAQAGSLDAQNELLSRCLPRLNRWASGRLSAGLRSMLDTGNLAGYGDQRAP
jgi:hypothetical protein